jgi:hypothetical protein
VLALQTAGTTAVSISASQVVTLTNALAEASGGTGTSTGYYGFKNRIINGGMVISQAAGGASITPASTGAGSENFAVDRFRIAYSQNSKLTAQQNKGSVTPPAGFKNYIGIGVASTATVGATDYFLVGQTIEGYNISDLSWGTASAATVTLSFWAYSNTTGTFGGAVNNSAYARSYVFSYTINVADTWEQKTVTIAGDTSGTWLTENNSGMRIWFSLGTGSTLSKASGSWGAGEYYSATGATSLMGNTNNYLYITGVQLEKGSTATSFDYRPYGTEFMLCQRYYYVLVSGNAKTIGLAGYYSSTVLTATTVFPVTMRTTPSLVQTVGTSYYGVYANSGFDVFDSFNDGIQGATPQTAAIDASGSSGVSGTSGSAGRVVTNNASSSIAFSAEL